MVGGTGKPTGTPGSEARLIAGERRRRYGHRLRRTRTNRYLIALPANERGKEGLMTIIEHWNELSNHTQKRQRSMLRITFQATADGTSFKLEGELDGLSVRDLERLWQRLKEKGLHWPVRVDLTSVLLVGEPGRRLLRVMHEDGAELVADDPFIRTVIQEAMSGNKSTAMRKSVAQRHN